MQLPFDSCFRRRVYLVRHGHALGTDAASAEYADTITLTQRGLTEARAMRDTLRPIRFDRVVSSDIGRALETARILIEGREQPLEQNSGFRELRLDLRKAFPKPVPSEDRDALIRQFAYGMFVQARLPEGSMFGSETYVDFQRRVTVALESLLTAESPASTILLVAHSLVNRAILCWMLGLGPGNMANFEQDTCCLNVLDCDVDVDQMRITRKTVRLMNFTPRDCAKGVDRLLESEESAPKVVQLIATHFAH